MSILGNILRHFQAHNFPLYTGEPAVTPGRLARARGKNTAWARSRYLEAMEPRVLLTTLYGGERFQYTDARGNTISAQLNGNVVAELVAATQNGADGSLIFGDISGTIETGPCAGTIVGNGSLPVSGLIAPNGGRFTSVSAPAGLNSPNLPPPPAAPNPNGGQQVNLQGIASNAAGQTFAFNAYNVSAVGVVATSPNYGWTLQLYSLNNRTGASTLADNFSAELPVFLQNSTTSTVTNLTIGGAAFNPINNLLDFELQFTVVTSGTGNGTTTTFVHEMFQLDTSSPSLAQLPLDLGDVVSLGTTNDFTAMTFVPIDASSADLWYSTRPNANAPALVGGLPPMPTLNRFTVDGGGNFDLTAPAPIGNQVIGGPVDIVEGYGPAGPAGSGNSQTPLTNLSGLAFLPSSGSDFLFGTVSNTAGTGSNNAHLTRISLNSATINFPVAGGTRPLTVLVATNWGNTADQYQVGTADGQNFSFAGTANGATTISSGLTYNPTLVDPFSGQLGALLSIDQISTDLCFVNPGFRVSAGDVFSVYSNQADISSSITFETITANTASGITMGSPLYRGSPGAFAPANTGLAFLGFQGFVPTNTTTNAFTANSLFLTGKLNGSVGIMPAIFSTTAGGTPTNELTAGLVVGYSLEQGINSQESLLNQLLGSGFSNVTNLAISDTGATVVINGHNAGGEGASDELGIVDPSTGAIERTGNQPVATSVRLADNTVLTNAQALAYGDPNFTGTQQLYAVYDLGDGNGPTLGTIDADPDDADFGLFTPIGSLGLGVDSRVSAIAFSPGGSSLNPSQQGLYAFADPNTTDASLTQTLYQIDPIFGEILNTIGPVITVAGAPVSVVSAAFDGSGRLLVDDQSAGRLMDVNLTNGRAGQHVVTDAGSINPTVYAIAYNPTAQQFYAVDNETGLQLSSGTAVGSNSSVLVKIKDFTQANADAVNLGGFLFDGVVTGRVFISGSINLFYCGQLLTGDATNGGTWLVSGGSTTAGSHSSLTDNFHANGDIRDLFVLTSIGTNATTTPLDIPSGEIDLPTTESGVAISALGKIGEVYANGVVEATVHAGDQTTSPNVTDGQLPQQEVEQYSQTGALAYTFADGYVVDVGVPPARPYFLPFDNRTFAGAQYLGTIGNSVSGQPDVIRLTGDLAGDNPPAGYQNDTVDYFAVSLLAGQTVTVEVQELGDTTGDLDFAIFDPDGRQIATDYNHLGAAQTQERPIQFTADKPGAYRIAIGLPGDTGFTGGGSGDDFTYSLTVTGSVGDMAIGGVVAGYSVVLDGNNGLATTGLALPSIVADNGDIGAVVAGTLDATDVTATTPIRTDTIISRNYDDGAAFGLQTANNGYVLNGTVTPQGDITTINGNLRAIQGGAVGFENILTNSFEYFPDLNISGKIGLLQAVGDVNAIVSATMENAAGGDIQVISSDGDIGGVYRTNKSIGVIRADHILADTSSVEFHANVDNIGSDGIIDLIDVTNDMGTNDGGGPSIVTGQGGNVRFIQVGGAVWQDALFASGQIGATGEVVHDPGPVGYYDDSGASLTLTPTTVNGVLGTLTTRIYGIRGAGGVVVVSVESTTGLQVNAQAGGTGRSAEIGNIITDAVGVALTVVNGIPQVTAGGTANSPANTVTIGSTDGTRVDVFDITVNSTTNTIDSITNTAGGDIENITAGDIGTIVSNGNLGSVSSTTGATVNPLTVFNNAYPFVDQRFGMSMRNIGSITSTLSIGNLLATGVVGTVTADSNNTDDDPNLLEGITGPIVANGTTGTINTVNIGEGIAVSGSGSMSRAGIFANGKISFVNGSNADIRGDIASTSGNGIGTITLNNGSIINADIIVTSSWTNTIEYDSVDHAGITEPGATVNIDQPNYVLNTILLSGNGGIIGSIFTGAGIGTVTVGSAGFGIFNSLFVSEGSGTDALISAGGYGIREVTVIDAARVGTITATGSGADALQTTFSSTVQLSKNLLFNPFSGTLLNELDDLNVALNGDGDINGPDPAGTTTGVIENLYTAGQDRIAQVSAYDFLGTQTEPNTPTLVIDFANSTGSIIARNEINGLNVISGALKKLTVGQDVEDVDIKIAGPIGTVAIGGSFLKSSSAATSIISAKGPSGTLGSFTVSGNDDADLFVQSNAGNITIGTAGTGGHPSSGDFSGTIDIIGKLVNAPVLTMLQIFGAILGGSIDITGNAGTINVAHDLTGLTNGLVVNGNLANLIVGSDTATNNSELDSPVTVLGNLNSATITGQMNGNVTVSGNVGTFTVAAEPGTAPGTDLLNASLKVGGSISNLTVQGGVAANVIAGSDITSATINGGNLESGGFVTSSLGNVVKLTINNGNLNGTVTAPNGAISNITVTGTNTGIGPTASISGRSMGTVNVPGDLAGLINIVNAIAGLTIGGSIDSTSRITAGSLGSLTTKLDMLGSLAVGTSTSAAKLNIGRDLGGYSSFGSPLSATVGRNMLVGSTLSSTNTITSLAAKGSIGGDILVDQGIGTISAATLSDAVITAGLTFSTLKITGAVSNSIVQVGVSRGNDGIFGTADLGEQARMGDLNSVTVGSLFNSIIAAGGNINTFKSTGNATGSSVSSGLVLLGGSASDSSVGITAVMADATPLDGAAELNAARQGAALYHGSFKSATVGSKGTSLFGSFLTAGVSPGADGAFGTADDNVNSSLTGGAASFGSAKAVADGSSGILAKTPSKGAVAATIVAYTLDGGANSIVQGAPVVGPPTSVATPTTPQTITTADGTITVTVKGANGTTVSLYDDPSTPDLLDTMVISSSSSTAVTVTVVTSAPGAFDIGRVLTTANTVVGAFTFNGDIEGNGELFGGTNVGPSIWIDSSMTTFSIRNLLDDGSWHGQIGGDIKTMTLNQLGSGQFRVGGRISTLNVAGSVGNPLLQQLGAVTPPTNISQMAINPADGSTWASDGTHLLGVDTTTGIVGSSVQIQSPFGTPLAINGLGYNAAGTLYGVTTINSQLPITQLGKITTTGDQLHALAVNSSGHIFAIDSASGSDTLVQLDPATGAETIVGVILDSHTDTFTNNVLAMAFDQNGNLLVLVNDQDGNGQFVSPGSGVALGVFTPSDLASNSSGFVHIGAPSLSGSVISSKVGLPILIDGPVFDTFTGMAVNSGGQIYVTANNGGGDELEQMVLTAGSTVDVALNDIGPIAVDSGATPTNGVGIGFDEHNNLILLNANGSTRELVGVNVADPSNSIRLTVPALLNSPLSSFALGKSGATFKAYGYISDPIDGGTLFTNPGVVPTLGIIATTGPGAGTFTQLLPLAQDSVGTGLTGTVLSVAIDPTGNIFVVTTAGQLAEYSSVDGSLIGVGPLGTVIDGVSGNALNIQRISFDDSGRLVGLDAQENRLVQISTTPTLVNGQLVLPAAGLTDRGAANASDLTSLAYSTADGKFLSYSNASGNFVKILGTSPNTLGGLIANSIAAANIASNFGGRIYTTGNGTSTSLDTLKFSGAGTYTGSISADGGLGAVTTSGTTFDGTLITGGGIKSIALSGGNVTSNGLFSAGGLLTTFTLSGGSFDGTLIANQATTITLNSSALADSLIVVANSATTVTVGAQSAGTVDLNNVNTFKVGGHQTGAVFISGDAGNVALSGGVDVGSTLLANYGVTSLTIGGTLAGVVGIRRSVGTVVASAIGNGVLDVGGNVTNLTVNGSVTDSIISVGTWIGLDGIYNTADDVIFGGSINNARLTGTFTDSVVAAGVLPRQGAASGVNNIPTDIRAYSGNPTAANIADVDSAEAGGIFTSSIQTIVFTQKILSTDVNDGHFSLVVTANGTGKVNSSGPLHQATLSDPAGQPTVVIDPTTNLPMVTKISPSEVRIVFSEPLDTATINLSTVIVASNDTGLLIPTSDYTFGYFTQIAPDGSIQGVLRIISANNFDNAANVQITLMGGISAPTITDRTGLRSALLDFNQDGTPDPSGDPLGTTIQTQTVRTGPINDFFARATVLAGRPVSTTGYNIGATAQPGEPDPAGVSIGKSVWYSWTAPSNGNVTIDTIGSDYDTTLGIYTGSTVSSLVLVADNDDINFGVDLDSRVNFNASAGTTYYIEIDGYFGAFTGATGHFVLNIS